MRKSSVTVAPLLLAACVDRAVAPPLENPEGRRTEVLMIGASTGAGPSAIHVFDTTDPSPVADLRLPDDADRLEAWLLAELPAQLGLAIGAHEALVGESAPDALGFVASLDEDPVRWTTDTLQWGAALKIHPPSMAECLEGGGCLVADRCETPCPSPPTPEAPVAPAPPSRAPCPAGWSQPDGVGVCAPWGGSAPPSCPTDTSSFLGEERCRPPGRASCEGWPDAPRDPDVLYVSAAAPAGGIGAPDRPLKSLELALSVGRPTIVVAPGEYVLTATRAIAGVRILGSCASGVRLRGQGALTLGEGASLEDVTLEGKSVVTGSVSVRAAFARTTTVAFELLGGALTLEDVAIQLSGSALGVHATASSTLSARRITIRGALTADGILASRARVTLEDAAFLSTRRAIDLAGGRATLRRTLGRSGVEWFFRLRDGRAELEEVAVSGTRDHALLFESGADGVVRGAFLDDNGGTDLYVGNSGTGPARAELEDLVSRGAHRPNDINSRAAIWIAWQADAQLRRALVREAKRPGVELLSAEARLSDVEVRSSADTAGNHGFVVRQGSTLVAERLAADGLSGAGFNVFTGASAQVKDLSVRDVGPGDCHACAGICARNRGSRVSLTRARVLDARGGALLAEDGATLDGESLTVDGVSRRATCAEGVSAPSEAHYGAAARTGGQLRADVFELSGSVEAGALYDPSRRDGTALELTNGALRRNATALLVRASDFELASVARGVRLEDNREALRLEAEE